MNAPPATAPAQPKPRDYKRFFTSAFHIRFVHATLLSLFICWDTGIFMVLFSSGFDIFWSWFPFGWAGLRAALFWVSISPVYLLLAVTISVGEATPETPFLRLRQSLCSVATLKTCLAYVVSAVAFTWSYILTCSDLEWVTKGDFGSPDRLNEQPIWLFAFFMVLGVFHAVKHVYFAHSTLQIPISDAPQPQANDQRTHFTTDTWGFLQSQAKDMLIRSAGATILATFFSPFIYSKLMRQSLWQIHLFFAKMWANLPRSDNRATGFPPIWGTFWTILWTGFWLGLIWEFAVLSLLSYYKKPPIKSDMPWTSSGKDPNGSLLNGIKAKRGSLKTFAFWELVIIAQSHPERRKAIFSDIDRKPSPIWTQMLTEALKVLEQLDNRIQPPLPPDPATLEPAATLPRILREPREMAEYSEERSLLAPASKRDARTRQKLLEIADDKIKRLGSHPETIQLPNAPDTTPLFDQFRSYFGWFFWPSNASKINTTVLGSPGSDAAIIVDAIEAITKMLTASLQDDAYGKAMAGVPDAVKQFTKTIRLIEDLLQQNPTNDNITNVEIILRRLKSGLSELLSAFQMFLTDTGLGIADLNAAKKASGQLEAEQAEQDRAAQALLREPARPEDDEEQDDPPPVESWREWRKPKTTSKLFANYDTNSKSRRQASGGRGSNGRANGAAKTREMEQVR